METVPLNSWEDFEQQIQSSCQIEQPLEPLKAVKPSPFYYRGQADAEEWKLETTLQRLQREINKEFDFLSYVKKAISICGIIDTYNNTNWNFDNGDITFNKYEELWDKREEIYKTKKRIKEYLIFLRHNGFPSPLLDWTKSPYIAAFFAFSEIPKDAQKVAIYKYQEMPYGMKHLSHLNIVTLEEELKAHKRHYLQQSCYTICLLNDGDIQKFGNYEEGFNVSAENNCLMGGRWRQDLLIKYTLPVTEQNKVLRKLDSMNINHFSLFETNEMLLKTCMLREIVLKAD
jgi:hypothetical protein